MGLTNIASKLKRRIDMKCSQCNHDKEIHTAYLLDRSKVTNICLTCKQRIEQENIDKMTRECFEKLCHAVNGGSLTKLAESMFRTFQRQHRYLQGSFFTVLWEFFKLYSNADFDPRNQTAVMLAKKWYDAI